MSFQYLNDFFNTKDKIAILRSNDNNTLLHSHSFFELGYVVAGRARHILNNYTTIIEKGDYFIIDPCGEHKYEGINNEKFEIINCLFVPEIIDKCLAKCQTFQELINNYLIKFQYYTLKQIPTDCIYNDKNQNIYELINKLESECNKKNPGYLEMIRCHLIEIFIITMRKISKVNCIIVNSEDETIRYLMNYVQENYMNPISLTELSSTLNYSLSYISRKFKQEVGTTFNEYLQKTRIEQSCRLLKNTTNSVETIAELVGYNDVKFFRKIFKYYIGIAPLQFRRFLKE